MRVGNRRVAASLASVLLAGSLTFGVTACTDGDNEDQINQELEQEMEQEEQIEDEIEEEVEEEIEEGT